jgi:hypothetical protein
MPIEVLNMPGVVQHDGAYEPEPNDIVLVGRSDNTLHLYLNIHELKPGVKTQTAHEVISAMLARYCGDTEWVADLMVWMRRSFNQFMHTRPDINSEEKPQ